MKRILISQIAFPKPNFKNSSHTKERIIKLWLIEWIKNGIDNNIFDYGMLIPNKKEFAQFFDVSVGTVQNAIRHAEEEGWFEAKQSIGTVIKNPLDKHKQFEKMYSKKDKAALEIKRYIADKKYKVNSKLPGAKQIAQAIQTSENTTRLALESLVRLGFLDFSIIKGNKSCWFLKKHIEFTDWEKTLCGGVENTSLIDKTAIKMKNYITENYTAGDKIISNNDFSKMLKVSIRTVNEASKILNKQKIILSRRGQYGTIFLNDPMQLERKKDREEKSVFMSQNKAKTLTKSYLYSWEKTLDALKKYIIQNHEAGDKIPSMKNLAEILGVSTNTIRRALAVMCEEGFLIAQRGKYGGVFIIEMPQKEAGAFTWLALNPDVIKTKTNKK